MRAVILDMPVHWLDERKRSGADRFDEMWDGVLHMPPSPSGSRQDFVGDFRSYLKRYWAKPVGGLVRHEINVVPPGDESNWVRNYRIPDIVLLSADRLAFDKDAYILGAPLICVEIRSPKDDSYDKLEFYAALGVPEVWIIDRDSKHPEVFALTNGVYALLPRNAAGWAESRAIPAEMLATTLGCLAIRMNRNDATRSDLPE